jgi:hypothetical protein
MSQQKCFKLVEPVKDTAASEIATDITETPIQHARKRALSGQQMQAGKLTRTTKRKLCELSVGNNVIIPIPQYDRGPTDPRNILGVIEEGMLNRRFCDVCCKFRRSCILDRFNQLNIIIRIVRI